MVKNGGRASWFIVDSTVVKLEGLVRGINGNRNNSFSNRVGEISFRSSSDIVVVEDISSNIWSLESAGKRSSSFIRVRTFGINTLVFDDVSEGIVHQTSIASVVSFSDGAIDEILFREGNKFSRSLGVSSFNGSGGGEGPARTALSLVLNGGNNSVGSPVDGCRDTGLEFNFFDAIVFDSEVQTIVHRSEFVSGKIGELVQGNVESAGFSVPVSDEFGIGGKDLEPVLVLFG
jgi:hypothetical protein